MRTLNCVADGPVRRWWRAGPFLCLFLYGLGVSGAGHYVTVTIKSSGGAWFAGEVLAGCQPNITRCDEVRTIWGNINRAKRDTFNKRPILGGENLKN